MSGWEYWRDTKVGLDLSLPVSKPSGFELVEFFTGLRYHVQLGVASPRTKFQSE